MEELYNTQYYKYYAAYLLSSLSKQGFVMPPPLDSLNMCALRKDLIQKHGIPAKMLVKAELMAMILLRKRLSRDQTKLHLAILNKSSVLYKKGESVELPEINAALEEPERQEQISENIVEKKEEEEKETKQTPTQIPFCLYQQQPPSEIKENSQLKTWLTQKISKVELDVSEDASDFLSKALHMFMCQKLNNVVNKYKRARHSYQLGSGKCTYAGPLSVVREPKPASYVLRKNKIENMTKMLVQKAEETIVQSNIKNAHVNVEKCHNVALEVDEKTQDQLYERMTCGSIPPKFVTK